VLVRDLTSNMFNLSKFPKVNLQSPVVLHFTMASMFLKLASAHHPPWLQKNNPLLAAGCGSGVGSTAGSGLGITAATGLKEESDA
jgi:hypothetical protein